MTNIESAIAEIDRRKGCYRYSTLYSYLQELINSGMSIKEISNRFQKLPSFRIIDCLLRYVDKDENVSENEIISNKNTNLSAIKNYYNEININEQRCLVIADNHLGRIDYNEDHDIYKEKDKLYKNEKGLLNAYRYAVVNGINNVIHLGDILEGFSDRDMNKIFSAMFQLQYLEKVYSLMSPYIKNVKTYLLYGNHDYNLIYYNWGDVTDDFYKLCTNTELIGVNYSYINFCGNRIKLSHPCESSSHLKNITLEHDFEMAGHSHMYNVYEEKRFVRIPSLASVPEYTTPAFIELIDEENEYVFRYITGNGTLDPTKERVLSKKVGG